MLEDILKKLKENWAFIAAGVAMGYLLVVEDLFNKLKGNWTFILAGAAIGYLAGILVSEFKSSPKKLHMEIEKFLSKESEKMDADSGEVGQPFRVIAST